jgi:hypothetical protein
MSANRITWVHVSIFGGVLAIILGVGLFFFLLKPLYAENTSLEGQVESAKRATISVDKNTFTYNQKEQAQAALDKAKARKARKERELAAVEVRKQLPPNEAIDLGKGSTDEIVRKTLPRWVLLPQHVIDRMNAFSARLAAKHRVRVFSDFKAPAPSTDPEALKRLAGDAVAWNLGTVNVTGDFNDVMRWARDWNSAPLLVAVDGLKCQLAGRNGRVSADANITVFIFPKDKQVAPGTATAAAPAGGGGMGGGGNGPMGGGGGMGGGMNGGGGMGGGMNGGMGGNGPR